MTGAMNRRQALAGFGSVSLGVLLASCGGDDDATTQTSVSTTDGRTTTVEPQTKSGATALLDDAGSCALTVEQTEGPYYFDAGSVRSDIREDRKGTELQLALRVREEGSCKPLPDAVVDIWHCDGEGVYSGFESASDERFLRGAQVTNSDGIVQFKTVYPGWYRGRTVHIHAKVHLDKQSVLTTQLYFADDFTAKVFESEPYASAGAPDTLNADDGIFDDSMLLKLARNGKAIAGAINLDVQST